MAHTLVDTLSHLMSHLIVMMIIITMIIIKLIVMMICFSLFNYDMKDKSKKTQQKTNGFIKPHQPTKKTH